MKLGIPFPHGIAGECEENYDNYARSTTTILARRNRYRVAIEATMFVRMSCNFDRSINKEMTY